MAGLGSSTDTSSMACSRTNRPFLIEPVPSNIDVIATRGLGAEGTTGQLFTFGDQVMRREYLEQ